MIRIKTKNYLIEIFDEVDSESDVSVSKVSANVSELSDDNPKAHPAPKIDKICGNCGETFKGYYASTYCSKECKEADHNDIPETSADGKRKCLLCEKEYTPTGKCQKYCSKDCYLQVRATKTSGYNKTNYERNYKKKPFLDPTSDKSFTDNTYEKMLKKKKDKEDFNYAKEEAIINEPMEEDLF